MRITSPKKNLFPYLVMGKIPPKKQECKDWVKEANVKQRSQTDERRPLHKQKKPTGYKRKFPAYRGISRANNIGEDTKAEPVQKWGFKEELIEAEKKEAPVGDRLRDIA